MQTGNPVFPFYNSIFKSPYLEIGNWLEDSYGPKNFIERLIWPLYTLINPRRSFDTNTYYGRVAFGYVIAFLILIINLYKSRKSKKIDKKEYFGFSMSILLITMCLIWSNFKVSD